jgi:C_GCAxxG_C_C family probable redox protein
MLEERPEIIEQMKQKVVSYFGDKLSNFPLGRSYNCCESVLLTLAEYLKIDSKLFPKIGTAIGAGVSLNGFLCGSITGVAMALGLKFGRSSKEESPQVAWEMMNRYITAFKDRFKAVNCRQLTNLDLKTKEGLKEYFDRVHDYTCAERLKFAIEKAMEIL